MQREIKDFYAERGLHLYQLMRKAPPGVTNKDILDAAEEVYLQIQSGENIQNTLIARKVWMLAKEATTNDRDESRYARHQRNLHSTLEEIKAVKANNQELSAEVSGLRGKLDQAYGWGFVAALAAFGSLIVRLFG